MKVIKEILHVLEFFISFGNMTNIHVGRTKRSVSPTSISWPPRSIENWIEVLVVVDGPMVKYHGKRIRHYVLTLMQIVSGRLVSCI